MDFADSLNKIHQLLEFSIKSQKSVCFLDVEVTKEGSQLNTTLYTKEMDRNNLLWRESHHASQTFRGIPKGQFIRKICSKDLGQGYIETTLRHKIAYNSFYSFGLQLQKVCEAVVLGYIHTAVLDAELDADSRSNFALNPI